MDSSMLKGVTNLVKKLTSGKANSGLVGLMLNADQVTNWVIICALPYLLQWMIYLKRAEMMNMMPYLHFIVIPY